MAGHGHVWKKLLHHPTSSNQAFVDMSLRMQSFAAWSEVAVGSSKSTLHFPSFTIGWLMLFDLKIFDLCLAFQNSRRSFEKGCQRSCWASPTPHCRRSSAQRPKTMFSGDSSTGNRAISSVKRLMLRGSIPETCNTPSRCLWLRMPRKGAAHEGQCHCNWCHWLLQSKPGRLLQRRIGVRWTGLKKDSCKWECGTIGDL